MKCEGCNEREAEKYSKYASGRFCSKSCSQSFISRNKRPWNKGIEYGEEYKQKISDGLKSFFAENGAIVGGEKHSKAVGKGTIGKFGSPQNLFEMSMRTKSKILRRLKVKCCVCGWDEEVVDLHHIIPRKNGGSNDHSNITPLCPNHHRLAEKKKLPIEKMKTLDELIGDTWKAEYYG